MSRPLYEHTQTGWPIRAAFFAVSLVLLTMAAWPPISKFRGPPLVLVCGAFAAAAFGWVWGALTVSIQDGELRLRFGPGWPRKRVQLADVTGVELTHTTFSEGWGVHRTRRGWLYNVSGCDAVLVRLRDGRAVLVGSDEPRRLRAALERALKRG
jgi:hypothetical protein